MRDNKHRFLSCYDQLLWYKPEEGIYTAFGKKDLRGYVGNCPNIHEDYQESTGKQNAMMTQFFSIVDTDNDFYEKSLINTKYFMAFQNGVFDYKKQELKAFSPDYYFTLKAPIDYKDRSQLDSKTIEKERQNSSRIFLERRKGTLLLNHLPELWLEIYQINAFLWCLVRRTRAREHSRRCLRIALV